MYTLLLYLWVHLWVVVGLGGLVLPLPGSFLEEQAVDSRVGRFIITIMKIDPMMVS